MGTAAYGNVRVGSSGGVTLASVQSGAVVPATCSQPVPADQLPGEVTVLLVRCCWGWGPDHGAITVGTFMASNFSIQFLDDSQHSGQQIPLGALERVELRSGIFGPERHWWDESTGQVCTKQPDGTTAQAERAVLDIVHRRGTHIVLYLPGGAPQEELVEDWISRFVFPGKRSHLFAFSFRPNSIPEPSQRVLSRVEEFTRQGVAQSHHWRISHANAQFQLCETYPQVLVVPSAVSDADLLVGAQFRTMRRVINLSWMSASGVGLCRSSQPKTGMLGASSHVDQAVVAAVAATGRLQPMLVIDCRPSVNAYANAVAGGGYESAADYQDIEFKFCDIANIHAVRSAHAQLREAAASSLPPASVQAEDWTKLVSSVLGAAVQAVDAVDGRGAAVLVHCSDGWDRTPQVTSLAMIMLDGFYRTAAGFCSLVRSEWVEMGHQFYKRHGPGCNLGQMDSTQRAPIFLQFLDCVWQILNQNLAAFRFGEGTLEAWDWLMMGDTHQQPAQPNVVINVDPTAVRLWTRMHLPRWGNSQPAYTGTGGGMLQNLAENGTAVLDVVFGSSTTGCPGEEQEEAEPDGVGAQLSALGHNLIGEQLGSFMSKVQTIYNGSKQGAVHLPFEREGVAPDTKPEVMHLAFGEDEHESVD